MVFEQLFSVRWLEKKEHAILLGFGYTLLAMLSARLIFYSNVGLMSIAFASILLVPSLNALLRLEENVEIREKKLSFISLMKDHRDVFKVYIYLFLGIFLAYALVTLFFPDLSAIERIFGPQLMTSGIHGNAFFSDELSRMLINNLLVFLVCFILSLVYGAGSILFLTWNASVWGVVFAYFIRMTYIEDSGSLTVDFFSHLVPFLPHMVTEAVAYISAAIMGGVVSKAVVREKLFSPRFNHILTDALIFLSIGLFLVLVAAIIEVGFFMSL